LVVYTIGCFYIWDCKYTTSVVVVVVVVVVLVQELPL